MKKQIAVAYISAIVTFILLVVVIIFHISLLIRKDKRPKEEDGVLSLIPGQIANAEIIILL